MHGYGEFTSHDDSKYYGFFQDDKKHGFGVYYWNIKTELRVYVGFWSKGKQDGIGKYINRKGARYGVWNNGERIVWLKDEEVALGNLEKEQKPYKFILRLNLSQINAFLNGEKRKDL